jgi:hypothetical protein
MQVYKVACLRLVASNLLGKKVLEITLVASCIIRHLHGINQDGI